MSSSATTQLNIIIANLSRLCRASDSFVKMIPSEDEIKSVLGEKYIVFRTLMDIAKDLDPAKELDKICSIYTSVNVLLEDFIRKKAEIVKVEQAAAISALNEEVAKHHDPKHCEPHTAYILFSDGEISYTKGGDLYGRRSFFQDSPPICDKTLFKLPVGPTDGMSSANMTLADCRRMRAMMLEIVK